MFLTLDSFSQKEEFITIIENPTTSVKDQGGPSCWSYATISFAKFLHINTDDYISLTSYTHHPFYTNFALEIRDNYASGMYYKCYPKKL